MPCSQIYIDQHKHTTKILLKNAQERVSADTCNYLIICYFLPIIFVSHSTHWREISRNLNICFSSQFLSSVLLALFKFCSDKKNSSKHRISYPPPPPTSRPVVWRRKRTLWGCTYGPEYKERSPGQLPPSHVSVYRCCKETTTTTLVIMAA